ncbi:sialin-like, partial [Argonauta hians]
MVAFRYVLVGLSFLGFMLVYALRVNLSVAIVAITSTQSSAEDNSTRHCPMPNDTTYSNHTGEFDWDSNQQGLLLGAFFYGYICTQLAGGMLADWFGGKYLFGLGVFITASLSLVIPVCARWSYSALLVIRVLQGVFEGVTFPAMHNLLGKWSPQSELSTMAVIAYSGAQMGTVVSLPISGLLAESQLFGGWPGIFYVPGIAGIVWFLGWLFVASNSPTNNRWISPKERLYIETTAGSKKKFVIPWRSILTSPSVWAINAAHVTFNWNFYLMLTCLPLYMKNVLYFDMSQNSLYSAIPYALLWFLMNVSGVVADRLRKDILSTTTTRKLANTLGLILPAVLLGCMQYAECNRDAALAMVIVAISLSAISMAGYQVNHLDIAPNFAGLLMGISNTFATIPGFVAPSVVGAFTHTGDPYYGWIKVFYLSVGINVTGALLYLVFGSGQLQSWAEESQQQQPIVNSEFLEGSPQKRKHKYTSDLE